MPTFQHSPVCVTLSYLGPSSRWSSSLNVHDHFVSQSQYKAHPTLELSKASFWDNAHFGVYAHFGPNASFGDNTHFGVYAHFGVNAHFGAHPFSDIYAYISGHS